MKTPYDSWSIEALRAYVLMTSEFLSGSVHEEMRDAYSKRYTQASSALKIREDEQSGLKTSVAFPSEMTSNDVDDVPT